MSKLTDWIVRTVGGGLFVMGTNAVCWAIGMEMFIVMGQPTPPNAVLVAIMGYVVVALALFVVAACTELGRAVLRL